MTTFVRLTIPSGEPEPVVLRVRADYVVAIACVTSIGVRHREGAASVVTLFGASQYVVVENPAEIAALVDPDGCADPRCGYDQYLGARRDTDLSDLSHRGYHAAQEAATSHITGCHVTERTGRICSICLDHERRLRA